MWLFIIVSVIVIVMIMSYIDNKEKAGGYREKSSENKYHPTNKNTSNSTNKDISSSIKKEWQALISEGGVLSFSQTDIRLIGDFLIPDNIDPKKYRSNSVANRAVINGMGLSITERIDQTKINCTPTFRENFSEDTLNRGLQVPDWFYIAYPDVAHWMNNSMGTLDRISSGREDEFINNGKPTNAFFKEIINYYKDNVKSELECSYSASNTPVKPTQSEDKNLMGDQNTDSTIATIKGVYVENRDKLVVEYKGEQKVWDAEWITNLHKIGHIEVLSSNTFRIKNESVLKNKLDSSS